MSQLFKIEHEKGTHIVFEENEEGDVIVGHAGHRIRCNQREIIEGDDETIPYLHEYLGVDIEGWPEPIQPMTIAERNAFNEQCERNRNKGIGFDTSKQREAV